MAADRDAAYSLGDLASLGICGRSCWSGAEFRSPKIDAYRHDTMQRAYVTQIGNKIDITKSEQQLVSGFPQRGGGHNRQRTNNSESEHAPRRATGSRRLGSRAGASDKAGIETQLHIEGIQAQIKEIWSRRSKARREQGQTSGGNTLRVRSARGSVRLSSAGIQLATAVCSGTRRTGASTLSSPLTSGARLTRT
jgi:hypothetical protein